MSTAEKTGLLSGIVIGQVEKAVPARQRHGPWQAVAVLSELGYQCPETGIVVRCRRRIKIGPIVPVPGQHVVKAPAMAWMLVMHAANQAKLVRLMCQTRQVLANLDAWNIGRDRAEFAAKMGWGFRLQVKRIKLTGAA